MSGHQCRSALACWRAIFALTSFIFAAPTMAAAQTAGSAKPPKPKWEVSIQAGGAHPGIPLQGIQNFPEQTPLFTTVNGRLSRTVPTWFVATGASLLNQVITQAQTGVMSKSADPVAFAPTSNFSNSWSLGGRVSRAIDPRFSFEGSVDYSRSQLGVIDSARPAIDATVAAYVPAWTALLATDPVTFQNVDVSATSIISTPPEHQILASGALIINILTQGRNTPYVLLGTGVMTHGGADPSVTFVGRIRTLVNGTAPVDETDTMTLRYEMNRTLVTVTVGAGWKHMMGERWGVRGEVREQLNGNPVINRVTATPGVVVTSTTADQGAVATNRFVAVQFSNIPGSSPVSSLSSSLKDFAAFETTGMENRLSFTGGIFWRF